MNIMWLLTNHRHYWGIPHDRPSDDRMVQTCYECGAERVIKINLRDYRVEPDTVLEHPQPKAA